MNGNALSMIQEAPASTSVMAQAVGSSPCVDTDYCYSKYTKDGFDKMYVVDSFTLTNTINSMYDVNFTEQEIKSALYESEQY